MAASASSWRAIAGSAPTPRAGSRSVKEPLTDYEFTIIEIRLDGKGVGEGRTSLTTKVVVDADAKTVALESYQAAPAILRNVKRS